MNHWTEKDQALYRYLTQWSDFTDAEARAYILKKRKEVGK